MTRIVFLLLFLIGASPLAYAETEEPTPLTILDASTKKIMEGMDENQTLQFAAIRNSHGIIRAVESVEKNIDDAYASCSKTNPELAEPMKSRIGIWKGTIDPVVEEAHQRMETMIKLQDFAKPSEERAYLKKIDEAVAYKSRGTQTVAVKSKEECEKLLETLDDTEAKLKKLLIENLGLKKDLLQKPE